ncbi:MAG: heavy metal translocating P-type ATPase [Rhodocyclaceae bacterium]
MTAEPSAGVPTHSESAAAEICYHCGLPLPREARWQVVIDGASRQMCCAGCEAVASAIVAGGLADYYRHRASLPESPREAIPESLASLSLFDNPGFQQGFVRPMGDDEREADLILEGITCAACVWLNERHLAGLPGVTAVHTNFATRRARVRWRDGPGEGRTKLSSVLAAVTAIGYRAWPYDPQRSEEVAARERKTALWRVLVAGLGMMQVMMYAYPAYIAGDGDLSPWAASLMRWASLLLTVPVVGYSAAPFFQRAWRDLRMWRMGMDIPVALGIGSAFLASLWATVSGRGEVYFDSVTMFVFFLLGARYLEMLARQRAVRGAEVLGRLMPVFARRVAADGSEERIASSELRTGDAIRVLPGETVVVNGQLTQGGSELDESWLTGESRPQRREAGDKVLAGSVNRGSPLLVRATGVGDATRLAGILRLVERAAAHRPRVAELADRIAGWFVLILLCMAALTGVLWWQTQPDRALWIFVSVLVVSCPCALSLATPIALTVATEALARAGLLVTRGQAIETLARVDHFVFDKTGTLSEGRMTLQAVHLVEGVSRDEVLRLAAALEAQSGHHIARALLAAASVVPVAESVAAVTGQGLRGVVAGVEYAIGRQEFVAGLAGCPCPASLAEASSDVLLVSSGRWLAAFGFDDALRTEAPMALERLRAFAGLSVFSGDSHAAVSKAAAQCRIEDARAGMTPEGKQQALASLQTAGHVVAMVGDGVNDAPVLAQAHVSIAMGGGTDLARQSADIVLLRDDLSCLPEGVRIARRSLAIIRQNLVWAAAYNLLAIPAAMAGWVSPLGAGVGMGTSSLLVVLNALRIAR